jgi:uncharacterized protein
MQIIDADGHVYDRAYMEEIAKYMPKGAQSSQIFPALDHLHHYYIGGSRGGGIRPPIINPGPEQWVQFLDKTGIEWSVLYPTAGLAVGRIASMHWAIAACRAYNNWLFESFLNSSSRLKGMALIPVQDVDSAVGELRRAVTELGMCGAMLPSNGEGLKDHLGSKSYWPIYEEAEKLGCGLAVHGGCHHHLGMDTFGIFYPVSALGHPFALMIQAAGMLSHGVFDHFPGLRVAFLEGGATWVPCFMDRMDRLYDTHLQYDLEGNLLLGPKPGEKASEHFKRHVREGRIFVGFDCDDAGLGYAMQTAGREAFLFASDFPHESTSADYCRREIDELLAREDISQENKEAILGLNAQRFYRVDVNKVN